jgi:hypothetical protein
MNTASAVQKPKRDIRPGPMTERIIPVPEGARRWHEPALAEAGVAR